MCSLCSIVMVPVEFLLSLFILALSYLFLLSQMAVMFIVQYVEYFLSKHNLISRKLEDKSFKPKTTP